MNACKTLHCFNLEDDDSFNDQVQPVTAIQPLVLINNRKWFLALHVQATRGKFGRKTRKVRIFQQSWSELVMNLQGRADDDLRERVEFFMHSHWDCKS